MTMYGNVSLSLLHQYTLDVRYFLRSNFRLLFIAASFGVTSVSCGDDTSAADNVMIVSIEPLRFIVEEIVGDDFEVAVLVSPGASPETYEPTPLQIKAVEDACLVFSTGLVGFETIMLDRLPAKERFVDLSAGIELIAAEPEYGSYDHKSSSFDGLSGHDVHKGEHGHAHNGVDPHIWVSPKALALMARTAYDRIHAIYPDSTSYTVNYEQFAEHLADLDSEVSARLAKSPSRSFMIFHPGLTYYARDYGLRQIALESDGKEPSVRQLAETVELARAENITKVLYQSEFPRSIVEVAAAEIGAEPVEIDILGYGIIDNILKITEIISESDTCGL